MFPIYKRTNLLALFTVIFIAIISMLLSNALAGTNKKAIKPTPKQSIQLIEQIGKEIFFDKNLSNPPGLSCASCHNPEAGYAGSSNSEINATLGVMPGAVSGRFVNRKPPTISYAQFCPKGPPFYQEDLKAYFGGFFSDGRAPSLIEQVHFPLLHPNEMNNTLANNPAPQLIIEKIEKSKYAKLLPQVYGKNFYRQSKDKIIQQLSQAVEAFECSKAVSPFSSKYDAYLAGKAKLTDSELNGLKLVTGSQSGRPSGMPYGKDAQCVLCHGIPTDREIGPDLWTLHSYENVGVPKNIKSPYYNQIDKEKNPLGYNRSGKDYIDFGLGEYAYPAKNLPPGNIGQGSNGQGDFLAVNGKFKIPTLRNVDKRPNANFVKAYMHNGYFKSLKDVVHFYNTRNLTSVPGEIINFTHKDPYAGLQGKPLWPPPEYSSPITLQNPEGLPAQIGNLGLSEQEENDIVAFLKTLSDGYTSK